MTELADPWAFGDGTPVATVPLHVTFGMDHDGCQRPDVRPVLWFGDGAMGRDERRDRAGARVSRLFVDVRQSRHGRFGGRSFQFRIGVRFRLCASERVLPVRE